MTRPPLIVSPSLLSADFARLADDVRRVEDAGADWLHVDVMDGHFVPNLTIGPPVVKALRAVARRPLDVHLMITEPGQYAPAFAKAGAHGLTFHWEAAGSLAKAREWIALYRDLGISVVGISVSPETPIEPLEPLLSEVDLVLVMSVRPGFGGQRFMPEVLAKTRRLRERGFEGHVQMDGGLDAGTVPACVEAGANVLVAGSAIFGAPDMAAVITGFRAAGAARGPAGAGTGRPRSRSEDSDQVAGA